MDNQLLSYFFISLGLWVAIFTIYYYIRTKKIEEGRDPKTFKPYTYALIFSFFGFWMMGLVGAFIAFLVGLFIGGMPLKKQKP